MEEAARELAGGNPLSTAHQAGALTTSDLDVAAHRVQLPAADNRPHLHSSIEAVADFQLARPFNEPVQERLVHALMHDDAAGCRAALSRGAETAPQTSVDRQVEVRVLHDHDDVLAAHLEVHLLERRRRLRRDGAADVG